MATTLMRNCRQCHKKRPPQHFLDYPDHEPSNGPAWSGIRKDMASVEAVTGYDGPDSLDDFDDDEDEDATDALPPIDGKSFPAWAVIGVIGVGVLVMLALFVLPAVRRQRLHAQAEPEQASPQ